MNTRGNTVPPSTHPPKPQHQQPCIRFLYTMSFGFGVGDFLVTIELALKIYEKYYKVARGAPKEFQCLIQEIGILHHSLDLLRKEANNKESILVRAGDERMKMAEKVVRQVDITLQKLEKHSKKYENLSKIHSSSIKKWWTGVKWSAEASDLDALRNKVSTQILLRYIPVQIYCIPCIQYFHQEAF